MTQLNKRLRSRLHGLDNAQGPPFAVRVPSTTMWVFEGESLAARALRWMVLGALVYLANSCGSSSITSVSGPSASKCTTNVTNSSPSLPAAGGTGTLTIGTARECSWSATADGGDWIRLNTTDGQGPATITYSVSPNTQGTQRRGSIAVAEHRLDIVQEAAQCRYDVTPPRRNVDSAGGDATFNVAATPGCAWKADSSDSWLGNAIPSSGVGNAVVRFSVAPNASAGRTGNATIAGVKVGIDQTGASAPAPTPPAPTPAPPDPIPAGRRHRPRRSRHRRRPHRPRRRSPLRTPAPAARTPSRQLRSRRQQPVKTSRSA